VSSLLCSTWVAQDGLLPISSEFRICKCLDDYFWAERDCKTQHRAHLNKVTARSLIWFVQRLFPIEYVLIFWLVQSSSLSFSGSQSRRVTSEDEVAPFDGLVAGEARLHR